MKNTYRSLETNCCLKFKMVNRSKLSKTWILNINIDSLPKFVKRLGHNSRKKSVIGLHKPFIGKVSFIYTLRCSS